MRLFRISTRLDRNKSLPSQASVTKAEGAESIHRSYIKVCKEYCPDMHPRSVELCWNALLVKTV